MQELITQSVNYYLQLPAEGQAAFDEHVQQSGTSAQQKLKDMRDPATYAGAELNLKLDELQNERLRSKANPENSSAHILIDQLIAQRPETAKNMLATIRALLKEERVEATTVPAVAHSQLKPKKVSAG